MFLLELFQFPGFALFTFLSTISDVFYNHQLERRYMSIGSLYVSINMFSRKSSNIPGIARKHGLHEIISNGVELDSVTGMEFRSH